MIASSHLGGVRDLAAWPLIADPAHPRNRRRRALLARIAAHLNGYGYVYRSSAFPHDGRSSGVRIWTRTGYAPDGQRIAPSTAVRMIADVVPMRRMPLQR